MDYPNSSPCWHILRFGWCFLKALGIIEKEEYNQMKDDFS